MPSPAAQTDRPRRPRGEKLALGGALGLSALIASCCLGPALFLLFGVSVGALGTLSALEPFRPAFIAVGGALLAFAGWRIHRPAPAAPGPCAGEACAPDAPGRRSLRRLFWLAVALYAAAVAYPVILGALYG